MIEAFIIGVFAGVYGAMKFGGFEISIRKKEAQNGEKVKPKGRRKETAIGCDLCRGEKEIRLAGSSARIDCPKCRAEMLSV